MDEPKPTSGAPYVVPFIVVQTLSVAFWLSPKYWAVYLIGLAGLAAIAHLTSTIVLNFFKKVQVRLLDLALIIMALGNIPGLLYTQTWEGRLDNNPERYLPFAGACFIASLYILASSAWALHACRVLKIEQALRRMALLLLSWLFLPALAVIAFALIIGGISVAGSMRQVKLNDAAVLITPGNIILFALSMGVLVGTFRVERNVQRRGVSSSP